MSLTMQPPSSDETKEDLASWRKEAFERTPRSPLAAGDRSEDEGESGGLEVSLSLSLT